MRYILILGAKSDIAKACAKVYARNGFNLYLAGRKINDLKDFASDLKIRNSITVELREIDITNFDSHQKFYNSLKHKPVGVIVAAGYMPEQKDAINDVKITTNTINVNYVGAVIFLNIVASDLEKRRKGFIVGISSIAGERGRRKNYIYGSSKAGFTAYLSGLRNRLQSSKVNVITVKPGFVYTKMTENMDLPNKLTAQPDEVAKAIFNAERNNKDIIYIKSIWKYVALVINHIPEFIFKRMNI